MRMNVNVVVLFCNMGKAGDSERDYLTYVPPRPVANLSKPPPKLVYILLTLIRFVASLFCVFCCIGVY